MKDKERQITLIAGPTASGKSRLATHLALHTKSVIVNADSMQVYDVLRILTARPQPQEMEKLPHYLYGFVHPSQPFSTGLWYKAVRDLLEEPSLQHANLIFVGGTGLYFRALGQGLVQIPPIPDDIREDFRHRLQRQGAEKLYETLQHMDPLMAPHIKPQDGQRIIRALEVFAATKRSLREWQSQKSVPLIDMAQAQKILLLPERQTLYQHIEQRVDHMLAQGALDEVRELLAWRLEASMPAMKAIGVPTLHHVLQGNLSMAAARVQIKQETRHYAKRQMTWFRTQLREDWQIFTENPLGFACDKDERQ